MDSTFRALFKNLVDSIRHGEEFSQSYKDSYDKNAALQELYLNRLP